MDLQGIAVAKGTSMIVLGGVAFIITVLPVLFDRLLTSRTLSKKSSSGESNVLSLFLSFGGGVLLCTTFLHLLPEVAENIETLQKAGKVMEDFPLPLPELIMCAGFFTMYIIEELVHKFLLTRDRKITTESCNISHSTVTVEPSLSMSEAYKEALNQDVLKMVFTPPHEEDISIFPKSSKKNYGSSCSSHAEVNHNNHHDHYDHDHQHHDVSDHHHHQTDHQHEPRSLRELLMVLALSVHEAFEGLAIGLESSVGAVWYMLAAVAVHKCVIAFCIGVELVSGRVSFWGSVLYAIVYSCASPVGIAVGILLSSTDQDVTTLLSVGLQGLATGTLLYVVFFEVLHRDTQGGSGLFQLLSVLAGFFLMAILIVVIDA